MRFQQEIKNIQKGEVASLYLVLGTEYALKEKFKQTITHCVLTEEEKEMNLLTVDLNETPLQDALLEASSIPFFGEKRLIFIEHPTFLTSQLNKGVNAIDPDDLKALDTYIAHPLSSSIIVFFAPYEKLDERKKIVKQLKKKSVLIDISPVSEKDVRMYVNETIAKQQIALSKKEVEQLLELTDFNLSKVEQELEKIALYQSTTTHPITKQELYALVPRTLQKNIFDLSTYFLKGDTTHALRLFEDLLVSGQDPLKLNSIFIQQFRLYFQVKLLMQQHHYQQAQMASFLNVHPYRVKLAMKAVHSLSLEYLSQLLNDLIEQEYNMKQSIGDKKLSFELFILKYGKKSI